MNEREQYPNLIEEVDPAEVEGVMLVEGYGPGKLSPRVYRALNRSDLWVIKSNYWENEPINAGVLAETSEEFLIYNTRNLGQKGIENIKSAIIYHAELRKKQPAA